MSLNTDLQTLKTNIEGVKSTLYTNLTNKGVTNIAETDTLSTLADKVATITVGEGGSGGNGIDFSPIGYDAELSAELNAKFNDDVAYSKTLYDAWNPNNTSTKNLYKGDTKLVYAPNINTSNVTSMGGMFSGCTSLTTIPNIDSSNVTDMTNLFNGCSGLTSVPAFATSKVTSMLGMFSKCASLEVIPELDTSVCTEFSFIFWDLKKIKRIEGINFRAATDSSYSNVYFITNTTRDTYIRYLLIKELGTQSSCTNIPAKVLVVWGVNTDEIPDARQSLIDSLITYSFDRATAGYPTCTITLSSTTKALLTEDEIAQITAKGFTIA